jgi:putative peptidoglycan lipid II flippase
MFRSLFTVGGLTLLSRILGYIRDAMIAHYIGVSAASDAWNAAFRFPNLFRRVFGEGAFNAAFVPMYSRRLEESGEAAADDFGSRTLSLMFFILSILFVVCFVFMGPITKALASGFDQERYELAVKLSRITVVYLVFVCLMAALSGILNSRRSFAPPAIAYVLLNVVFIAGLLMYAERSGQPEYVLAWCVVVAGVVQFAVVAIGVRRRGARLRWTRPRLDADMRRLGQLMGPGLASAGVQQFNLIVGTIVASYQAGAITYIYNADRVNQLPLGVIGMAFGVVLLPEITRQLRGGHEDAAIASLMKGVEFSLLISLPAMVAMMVIPGEMFTAMFRSGKFTAADVVQAGRALAAFAIGAPAYILLRVMLPGYYAKEDTRTPMRYTIVSAIANMLLCVGLFALLKHVGCALATSLSGWLNVILVAVGLRRIGLFKPGPGFYSRVVRMFIASALMGVAVWGIAQVAQPWLYAASRWVRLGSLGVVIAAGMTVYFGFILVLRVTTIAELRSKFRRRR